MRQLIFREMKQKPQGILAGFPRIFVKYAETISKQTVRIELCGDAFTFPRQGGSYARFSYWTFPQYLYYNKLSRKHAIL